MADKQPLVSIVTPSYNQARYLQATMDSVLGQSYPNIEYIVIDGGSTDESPAMIAARGAQLAYWVSEPDKGQTNAINKGFARANGEILAWLNSDDTYQPQAVAEAVAYLLAHPEAGLVYGEANFIDEHGNVIGRFPAAQTDHAAAAASLCAYPPAGVLLAGGAVPPGRPSGREPVFRHGLRPVVEADRSQSGAFPARPGMGQFPAARGFENDCRR